VSGGVEVDGFFRSAVHAAISLLVANESFQAKFDGA
jgi:hypothetical protein